MLAMVWRVCDATSGPASSPVRGSVPTWPEVKMKPLALMRRGEGQVRRWRVSPRNDLFVSSCAQSYATVCPDANVREIGRSAQTPSDDFVRTRARHIPSRSRQTRLGSFHARTGWL